MAAQTKPRPLAGTGSDLQTPSGWGALQTFAPEAPATCRLVPHPAGLRHMTTAADGCDVWCLTCGAVGPCGAKDLRTCPQRR
ncbi:MAG TPA: hypothetical protein VIA06_07350 [Candidatus Dormibacteraeota bacterium]|jgi:hypothetical protein|nr:hypothetical protein [Candidatus Dormibacteraeota bacterium]